MLPNHPFLLSWRDYKRYHYKTTEKYLWAKWSTWKETACVCVNQTQGQRIPEGWWWSCSGAKWWIFGVLGYTLLVPPILILANIFWVINTLSDQRDCWRWAAIAPLISLRITQFVNKYHFFVIKIMLDLIFWDDIAIVTKIFRFARYPPQINNSFMNIVSSCEVGGF